VCYFCLGCLLFNELRLEEISIVGINLIYVLQLIKSSLSQKKMFKAPTLEDVSAGSDLFEIEPMK
jgi:hypothetical protein